MSLRAALEQIYWRMERVIAPGLKYSQSIYEEVLQKHLHPGTRWLDVGCGHQVLPSWRAKAEQNLVGPCAFVVGTDAAVASLNRHRTIKRRVASDIRGLPFGAGAFNLVTANMVVEHLDDPTRQFQEVSRVLKEGGIFLFHTPHKFGYTTIAARTVPEILKKKLIKVLQGRRAEDVFPTFYRANTRNEIAALAARTGFSVIGMRMIVSSAELLLFPPFAFVELIWIRLLMSRRLAPLRTNIIAILQKGPTAKE